jgi:hypothetical protein
MRTPTAKSAAGLIVSLKRRVHRFPARSIRAEMCVRLSGLDSFVTAVGVVCPTTAEVVVCPGAVEGVVSPAAVEGVVSPAAVEGVVSPVAVEGVAFFVNTARIDVVGPT